MGFVNLVETLKQISLNIHYYWTLGFFPMHKNDTWNPEISFSHCQDPLSNSPYAAPMHVLWMFYPTQPSPRQCGTDHMT